MVSRREQELGGGASLVLEGHAVQDDVGEICIAGGRILHGIEIGRARSRRIRLIAIGQVTGDGNEVHCPHGGSGAHATVSRDGQRREGIHRPDQRGVDDLRILGRSTADGQRVHPDIAEVHVGERDELDIGGGKRRTETKGAHGAQQSEVRGLGADNVHERSWARRRAPRITNQDKERMCVRNAGR